MWYCTSFFLLTLLVSKLNCQNLNSITAELKKLETRVGLLEKQNKALKQENHELKTKISSYSEYCKLLPDDVCGACQCKDDDRMLNRYYCDCQNLQPKRDCLEFYQYGIKINGIYKVHQNILKIVQVYCDQTTDGGGWTIIQRRVDGSIDFVRDWKNYKKGFGQLQNEFWFGNENIFTMSLQGLYPRGNVLRIDMKNRHGVYQYAKYKQFQLDNENTGYIIHVSKYSGTATDELKHHSEMKFSTFDADNDRHASVNCADQYKAGWWFMDCFHASLNGVYHSGGKITIRGTGIHWGIQTPFNNHDNESLLFVEMKIRRNL